jgi:hypothetical protein
MIYGYGGAAINEYGLREMREVSLAAPDAALRELARFIAKCADEAEKAKSINWHRHSPESLAKDLGCDVIVLRENGA